MMGAQTGGIYYLHPLLAGDMEKWDTHFARAKSLGFESVLLAPPFLPGHGCNIFLTADHARLHPALGQHDSLPALQRAATLAREHGLSLLLDLVINRVACEAGIARGHAAGPAMPPDPRKLLTDIGAVDLDLGGADAHLVTWWQAWIAEWLDAGVAGFRCDSAHLVAPAVWTQIIGHARTRHPASVFIAWTVGADPDAVAALAGCGFNLGTSSSFAWNFSDGWLNADTERTSLLGGVLAMPELPFGPRLAARATDPIAACRRAAYFATSLGQSWLMPMGYEFGARSRLDPVHGNASDFAALVDGSHIDLTDDIVLANRRHHLLASLHAAEVLSGPDAAVTTLLRTTDNAEATSQAIMFNTRLDRASETSLIGILASQSLTLAEPAIAHGIPASLPPAESAVLPLAATAPVILPDALTPDSASAIRAPRIAIEAVSPCVDDGRFAAKRIVGEIVEVGADIICDGHETVAVAMQWRAADEAVWHELSMSNRGNDRWTAEFPLSRVGRHQFRVLAWSDRFGALRGAMQKLEAAGKPNLVEQQEAIVLIRETAAHHNDPGLTTLADEIARLSPEERLLTLLSDETLALMRERDPRPFKIVQEPPGLVDAERKAAGFSSWYELFPRSLGGDARRHGTFDDVIARLPWVRSMGFDTLYFPPIHPIGRTNRKGPNNSLQAGEDDPGSPYAIGSREGGHDAIHPELGTLEDFRRLIAAAASHGLEIALDFAIQCSPDHPWLREHPEWFDWRPDGTIKYAENPPKKYEDIVNVDFYNEGSLPALWIALRDIVEFWVREGVRSFRVDNPHTKPFPFWEWMINDVRARHPDVIFLAEAFTRPKVMYRLAKVGFSQSYTYFTWRNTAREMREYLIELNEAPVSEFFRPHFFVNTPDINPIFLHDAGRPGFLIRAVLAATLSGLWGVYSGFELLEAASLNGREEYLDSEKYQLRPRDHSSGENIIAEIRQLNQIRRSNPALHSHKGVRFLPSSNDQVLCYTKTSADGRNVIVAVVSFDPRAVQESDIVLEPTALGLAAQGEVRMRDLMRDRSVSWHTGVQRLRLDPASLPFALWRVELGESA